MSSSANRTNMFIALVWILWINIVRSSTRPITTSDHQSNNQPMTESSSNSVTDILDQLQSINILIWIIICLLCSLGCLCGIFIGFFCHRKLSNEKELAEAQRIGQYVLEAQLSSPSAASAPPKLKNFRSFSSEVALQPPSIHLSRSHSPSPLAPPSGSDRDESGIPRFKSAASAPPKISVNIHSDKPTKPPGGYHQNVNSLRMWDNPVYLTPNTTSAASPRNFKPRRDSGRESGVLSHHHATTSTNMSLTIPTGYDMEASTEITRVTSLRSSYSKGSSDQEPQMKPMARSNRARSQPAKQYQQQQQHVSVSPMVFSQVNAERNMYNRGPETHASCTPVPISHPTRSVPMPTSPVPPPPAGFPHRMQSVPVQRMQFNVHKMQQNLQQAMNTLEEDKNHLSPSDVESPPQHEHTWTIGTDASVGAQTVRELSLHELEPQASGIVGMIPDMFETGGDDNDG
eukprot:122804_1